MWDETIPECSQVPGLPWCDRERRLLRAGRKRKERPQPTIQPLPSHPQSPDFVSIYPTPFKITFPATGHKGGLCVYIFLPVLNGVAVLHFLLARLKPQIL